MTLRESLDELAEQCAPLTPELRTVMLHAARLTLDAVEAKGTCGVRRVRDDCDHSACETVKRIVDTLRAQLTGSLPSPTAEPTP